MKKILKSVQKIIRPDDGQNNTTAFYSQKADSLAGGGGSLPAFFKREEHLPPEVELLPMKFDKDE